MSVVINLLIVLEMLFVNLSVVNVCSQKKHSPAVTFVVLAVFTALLLGSGYVVVSLSSHFGNGNGLFALTGFLYLIPLHCLYHGKVSRILSVMCSAWIYTMIVFVLAVQISKIWGDAYFIQRVLVIQTLLYACSAVAFVRWIKHTLLFVIQNISGRANTYLLYTGLSWFAIIILINLTFIYPDLASLRIAALLVLTVKAYLTYLLMYDLVQSATDVKRLEEIAYIDHLTGIRNRASLFRDAEQFMGQQQPFTLIYMDLDRFKSINDQYGHLVGDEYLCFFAANAERLLGRQGRLYRMSGDEFICIYTGSDWENYVNRLQKLPQKLPDREVPYWGCSFGWARYPQDTVLLDRLIQLADRNMYQNKRHE